MTGENTGMVQTVLGTVHPDQLGVTLTHEHLLIDLAFHREPPSEAFLREIYNRPVTLETVGYLRHYGYPNRDDVQLLDIETAIEEIGLYKQHGGVSVVDATSIGISRDPVALARIARATGLNIIMGSSYYVGSSHPQDMSDRTEDEIFEQIVVDVTVGVDGTGIRSGIIGEVGCNFPLSRTTNGRWCVPRAGPRGRLEPPSSYTPGATRPRRSRSSRSCGT
jgi:phosphotriesterase-related protein